MEPGKNMEKFDIDFSQLPRQGSDIDRLLEAIQIAQGLDPQYDWGWKDTRPGAQALLNACDDIREHYACNEYYDERPWAVRQLLENHSTHEIMSRIKIALNRACDFVEEKYLWQNHTWAGSIAYGRDVASWI